MPFLIPVKAVKVQKNGTTMYKLVDQFSVSIFGIRLFDSYNNKKLYTKEEMMELIVKTRMCCDGISIDTSELYDDIS